MARFTLSIRLTVLSAFILFASATAVVAIGAQYYFSHRLAEDAAINQFTELSNNISERAENLNAVGVSITELLANNGRIAIPIEADKPHPIVQVMANMLTVNSQMYSLHVANDNDSYIQLTNLALSEDIRRSWQASPQDRWLELKVVPTQSGQLMLKRYLDENLTLRHEVREISDYYPTERFWFKQAVDEQIVKTEPYRFRFTHNSGVSMSKRTPSGQVVGVGIALSEMVQILQEDHLADSLNAFIFDQNGQIEGQSRDLGEHRSWHHNKIELTEKERIFLENNQHILVSNQFDYPPIEFSVGGEPRGYVPEMFEQVALQLGLDIEYVNGASFVELYDAFKDGQLDVLQSVKKNADRQTLGLFTDKIFDTQIVAVTRLNNPNNIHNVDQLAPMKVVAVEGYVISLFLAENYPDTEIQLVETPLKALQAIEQGEADIYIESKTVIEYLKTYYFLNKIKISKPLQDLSHDSNLDLYMLVNKDKPELHSIINKALLSLHPAFIEQLKAKWLYLENESNQQSQTLNLPMGRLTEHFLLNVSKRNNNELFTVDIDGEPHYAHIIPIDVKLLGGNSRTEYLGVVMSKEEALGPFLYKVNVAMGLSFATFMLLVPGMIYLVYLFSHPLSKMTQQLREIANSSIPQPQKVNSRIVEIEALQQELNRTLASFWQRYQSQQALFNSLNHTIHKVDERLDTNNVLGTEYYWKFANLLCHSINKSKNRYFLDKKLSQDVVYQIQVCFDLAQHCRLYGPVTTKHKMTKLEAGIDRIEQIRMRYEVLWREAEICYWQDYSREPDNKNILRQRLEEKIEAIKAEFAFVCRCNLGEIEIGPEEEQKLHNISMHKWVSKINPSLGTRFDSSVEVTTHSTYSPGVNRVIQNHTWKIDEEQNLYRTDELSALLSKHSLLSEEEQALLLQARQSGINDMSQLAFTADLSQVPGLLDAYSQACSSDLPNLDDFVQAVVVFSVVVVDLLLDKNCDLSSASVNKLLETFKQSSLKYAHYHALYDLMFEQDLHNQIVQDIVENKRRRRELN